LGKKIARENGSIVEDDHEENEGVLSFDDHQKLSRGRTFPDESEG